VIDKIFSLPGRGAKTYSAMKLLDEKLGFPHRQFKSIHVAGTNGKGSVATKIAKALQNLGYKVALYTSPHIKTFQERIQINGEMISMEDAERLAKLVYNPTLSFFDALTAMGFLYFAEKGVDYAVIETGLGGRFDATNVIVPIVSIITSIGLEHTAILGDTLEKIAWEKGGIVKPNVPLIVGPTAAPFFPGAITVKKEPLYSLENRSLAKRALLEMGFACEAGLEVEPPCRFEKIGDLILDVAHNPAAFEKLKEALQYHYPNQKHPFYLAFSKDKDWQKCIQMIEPVAESITFLKTDHPRLIQFPNAKEIIPTKGVVAGSFYIMEEIQIREGALAFSGHL